MRSFVISDNTDTMVGLRLAGVEGVVARTREEGLEAIDRALTDPEIGILLVTRALAGQCAERISPLKLSGGPPLVVEIPDPGDEGGGESITRTITEAIGIKL